MTGRDDLIRGVSSHGVQDIQAPDNREEVAKPKVGTPEQSRVKEVGSDSVEEHSLAERTVKPQFTKAELNRLFQEGLGFYQSSNFDAAIKPLTIAGENGHLDASRALMNVYEMKNEPEKAFNCLQMFARKDIGALAQLAAAYETGRGVDIDLEKAKELYFELGVRCEKQGGSVASGEYSYTSMNQAIEAYQHALELGYQEARVNQAECYLKLADIYAKGKDNRAIEAYMNAIEAGHPDAKLKLGDYYFGIGADLEQNMADDAAFKVRVLDYYRKAHDMGLLKAEEKVLEFVKQVTDMYESVGLNVLDSLAGDLRTFVLLKGLYASGILHPEMNRVNCLARFFMMISGKQPIINSHTAEVFDLVSELGSLYASDPDLSQKKKAEYYFNYHKELYQKRPNILMPEKVSAINERIHAFYMEMAQIYETGGHSVQVDQEQAYDYYMKVLESGYALPEAKMSEVLDYYAQKGIELAKAPFEDSQSHFDGKMKALHYLKRLNEYKKSHPDAPIAEFPLGDLYFTIGNLYERGIGKNAPNLLEAYNAYKDAIKSGYDVPNSVMGDLAFKIGNMYESGDGVMSKEEAHSWYREAISYGHAGAQFRYGMMHLEDEGYNPIIAFSNLKMAADMGYQEAIEKMADPEMQKQMKILTDDVIQKYESAESGDYLQALAENMDMLRNLIDLYQSGLVHPEISITENTKLCLNILSEETDIIRKYPRDIARLLVDLITAYKDSPNISDKEEAVSYGKKYIELYEANSQPKLFSGVDFVQSSLRALCVELAEIYEKGTEGVKIDKDKAYAYYANAILAGYELPEDKVIETYDYLLKKGLALAERPTLEEKLKAGEYFQHLTNYKNQFPDGPIDWPPAGKLYYEIAALYENEPDNLANVQRAHGYYEAAKEWEYAVPESKDIEIFFRFGRVYELGLGTEMDKAHALTNYEYAMNKGHLEARFKYGVMHIQGEGTLPNQVVGYTHVKTAAQMGQVDAINWMIDQAEIKNDPIAQLTLGDIFNRGVYGLPDIDSAILFYEMAEKQNVPEASLALGEIYLARNNPAEAVRHYQLGSERDNVECHRKLANLFYNGAQGVDVNKHLALQYFERLAFVGDAEAQYMAGLIYYRGEDPIFTGPLYERAVRHFNDAALQNHKEAEYILATMYLENKGVDVNLTGAERKERAVSLLQRASEHGSEEAGKRLKQLFSREQ